jgi:hypothetical protein
MANTRTNEQEIEGYGEYNDRWASRIGYINYRTSTGSRELLDLRFFRSIHRGHFFAQLETHFRRLPERHGLRNLRDDIHGFHIYDTDEIPATQSLL